MFFHERRQAPRNNPARTTSYRVRPIHVDMNITDCERVERHAKPSEAKQ